MLRKNKTSPEGHYVGQRMAEFCDEAEPKARLKIPCLLPRCESCALRSGVHLANGSPDTQIDMLHSIIDGTPFYCHQPGRENLLCSGWVMMMIGTD